jgi:hypothetical protein
MMEDLRDRFEYDGHWYKAVEHFGCEGCAFESVRNVCRMTPSCAPDNGVGRIWVLDDPAPAPARAPVERKPCPAADAIRASIPYGYQLDFSERMMIQVCEMCPNRAQAVPHD